MEQEGACSEKGKVVYSKLLSFKCPSLAGTLSNPANLYFTSSECPYRLQKGFLSKGSLLQCSLDR